ncbi:MAG: hypothetical protein K6E12_07420 [Saccharofermentans sp.]|nr:hypothetical protein [Saccharofermentans sp.]
MREEKKYEILPGVELPDFKTIKEAASDFSISDVGDVEVREVKIEPDSISASVTPSVSPEELAKLQSLGNKVAEDEARAQAESKKKMDEIKKKAVHASESISDLKSSNMGKVTDEKRKEIEESLAAEQQQKAEEDAKAKAREERRQLQLRLYEEAKERAAKEKAAAAEAEAKAENKAENKAEDKPAAEAAADKAPVEEKSADEKPAEDAAEKQEKQPAADTAASEKPAEAVKEEPKAETKEEPKSEPAPKTETKAPEINPERFVKDDKREATIASAEETYDDFKEFLDLGEEE